MGEWDRLDDEGCWELPVSRGAVLRRHGVPDMGSIRVLEDLDLATRSSVAGRYDRVELPTLHTAGWYDVFLQGTLDNHRAMAALGREACLIVGPWTHLAFADPIGEQSFGMRAARDGVPVHSCGAWSDLQFGWFRQHLDPGASAELPEAPVRIIVMGRNEWRDEARWPPQRAATERWFLHAGGLLSAADPEPGEDESEFSYDPANPVPAVGGHTLMWPALPSGPRDQTRDEVLVFSSAPLREELEVTGRVRVVLHAQSSARSTDWVARLCDVHPDRRSFNVCDGIRRMVDGADQVNRCEIDLWSTSNVFLPGHRLRVHVTSSSFPRWDRNLNTGNQGDSHTELARQRIYHDLERPSYVQLPVIRDDAR